MSKTTQAEREKRLREVEAGWREREAALRAAHGDKEADPLARQIEEYFGKSETQPSPAPAPAGRTER